MPTKCTRGQTISMRRFAGPARVLAEAGWPEQARAEILQRFEETAVQRRTCDRSEFKSFSLYTLLPR